MANICEFTITAQDELEQLIEIAEFLKPAIEPCPGGYYGEFVLYVEQILPVHEYSHPWIALKNSCQTNRNGSRGTEKVFFFEGDHRIIPECVSTQHSRLQFNGASKWCPPLDFVGELSAKFPSVEFKCSSTTEYEVHETWEGSNGDLVETEYMLSNPRDGEIIEWRLDGVTVPPDEYDLSSGWYSYEDSLANYLKK